MEDYDEGLARNITKIFGSDLYTGMDAQPLKAVSLSPDKEVLTFEFEDGSEIKFRAEGDCCSSSWIEHLEVPDGIAGQKLERVADARVERKEEEGEYECLQVYNTKFITDKGETITVEYRNSSNGYYGGYLVRV